MGLLDTDDLVKTLDVIEGAYMAAREGSRVSIEGTR